MHKPTGYSVRSFGGMITSEPRMSAYDAALRAAITPGCHVIDIGAGTGIFSLLACKYGAGHVTAIEPADGILLLKDMAKANGWADRITVFQGLSTEHVPQRKADVIVSDTRGIMPLFEHHIDTIVDARERLLAPGGIQIPMRDTLRAALVNTPKEGAAVTEPWLRNRYDLDMAAGHPYAANNYCKVYLEADSIVSDVRDVAVLDYRTITDPGMSASLSLSPTAEETVHGLLIWFDAELAEGVGFSNAPGEPQLVYGQSFLPFERPQNLAPDDRIEIDLKATLVDGDYVWTWATRIYRAHADQPESVFRQSSFKSHLISPDRLARRADSYVPSPSRSHALDAHILSLIDGSLSLRQIADAAMDKFPKAFGDPKVALDHVARLAERYHERHGPDASKGNR